MRMQVRSLASLSGLRVWCCCGCGAGRQLRLRFHPPGIPFILGILGLAKLSRLPELQKMPLERYILRTVLLWSFQGASKYIVAHMTFLVGYLSYLKDSFNYKFFIRILECRRNKILSDILFLFPTQWGMTLGNLENPKLNTEIKNAV